jgi:DNA-directed RNA polymerase subunit K/omega
MCVYNYVEEDTGDDVIDTSYVPNDERISKPVLYKYERVRLLGDRIKQLSAGAKPMIKNTKNLSMEHIAYKELENNVLPLKIERPLPNGRKELWSLSELEH